MAAKNVGIPVARLKIKLFVFVALCAALFAVLQVADAGSAAADRGLQKEFEAIIAAVIGGCLLTGGYGSVIGAAIGALIFGMVQIGIGYTSIDNNWYRVFLGLMLLVAVLFNNFSGGGSRWASDENANLIHRRGAESAEVRRGNSECIPLRTSALSAPLR